MAYLFWGLHSYYIYSGLHGCSHAGTELQVGFSCSVAGWPTLCTQHVQIIKSKLVQIRQFIYRFFSSHVAAATLAGSCRLASAALSLGGKGGPPCAHKHVQVSPDTSLHCRFLVLMLLPCI
jgi:hypothetical protein